MSEHPVAVQEILVPGKLGNNEGKPPHRPTEKDRHLVALGAATGMPHTDIAKVLGISKVTMYEHYRDELDTGKAKANMMVAGHLYRLCQEGNIAAIIFWCKTQMNLTESLGDGKLEAVDITHASKEVLRLAMRDADADFE